MAELSIDYTENYQMIRKPLIPIVEQTLTKKLFLKPPKLGTTGASVDVNELKRQIDELKMHKTENSNEIQKLRIEKRELIKKLVMVTKAEYVHDRRFKLETKRYIVGKCPSKSDSDAVFESVGTCVQNLPPKLFFQMTSFISF